MEDAELKTDVQDLREKIAALKHDLADEARAAKDRAVQGTTACAKEHPLAAIGIAAGIGAGIGLVIGLLGRRSRS